MGRKKYENTKRFLKDIEYDLLVPPLGLDFQRMTQKQAEENFDWFISKIPERMAYFRSRCADDLDILPEDLNYSPESLFPVWRWFLKTARMEKTPEEELEKMKEAVRIFGESFINREQFTVATKFIIRDIGMYVGQTYIMTYPQLYWHYRTKPRNSINLNQPLIAGFRAKYMGNEGDVYFQPIHMVEVQAANFFDKSQKETDLYGIFMKWVEYIPKKQE
jgi:hypothetical protein